MGYKRNLTEIVKIDCPCGFSRRPFSDLQDEYEIGSFHGTIFTSEKRAYPHFHVPTNESKATHETYFVTDEDTLPGSYIYLGKGAIEAKPGVLVNVHPGVVHGGTGNFTSLILGAPGFLEEGVIEIENDSGVESFYKSGLKNIITPQPYQEDSGFVELTAENPALTFQGEYDLGNLNFLVTQLKNGKTYAGAFDSRQLKRDGFRDSVGLIYITVRSGNGRIDVGGNKVPVKPLDVLMNQGQSVEIGEGLATTIMVVNPKYPSDLVKGL